MIFVSINKYQHTPDSRNVFCYSVKKVLRDILPNKNLENSVSREIIMSLFLFPSIYVT